MSARYRVARTIRLPDNIRAALSLCGLVLIVLVVAAHALIFPQLTGRVVDEATMERAAEVTSATVDAQEDIHASAAYRRSLAGTMVERALRSAAQ